MRKILLQILCSLLVVVGGVIPVNAETEITGNWNDSGNRNTAWGTNYESATEFTITSAEELAQFSYLVRQGKTFAGKTVKLSDNFNNSTNKLDLGSHYWTPIGKGTENWEDTYTTDDSYSFCGTFDGNGKTIFNLNIHIYNSDAQVAYIGLFGRIGTDGIVKDLTIDGGTLEVSDNSTDDPSCNIGSIAGVNHGTISNCTSNATINCYAPATDGGGIAGENGGTISKKGIIKNCKFTGTVRKNGTLSFINLGGIVGDNEQYGILLDCQVNNASIDQTVSATGHWGYIYGQSNGTVTDCYYYDGSNVTIKGRTLYKDGNWNTLCLPFNVTADQIAKSTHPLNGAIIKELDIEAPNETNKYTHITGVDGQTLFLNFKNTTEIEAGKPYLVKWTTTGSNLADPTFPGVSSFSSTDPENVSVISTDGNVTFIGTYFSKDIGADGDNTILYVGAGNTLYYPNAAMSIGALRAYFQLNKGYYAAEPSSDGIKAFNLDFGEESTGVKEIFDTPKTKAQGWYDLSGRRVDGQHLQRGLYMKDGKKVLK